MDQATGCACKTDRSATAMKPDTSQQNFMMKVHTDITALPAFRNAVVTIGTFDGVHLGHCQIIHLLEQYALTYHFSLIEIPQHLLNESAISSTRIREDLLNGNIERANQLLGYDYFFEGVVVRGNQLGRTIGYPTANLKVTEAEKL